MGRAPLGFCLMLRTPPGTPATHVRPRPGHEHGPGTTPSISIDPPINAFTQYVRPRVANPSGLPLARGRPDGTSRRLGFPPSFAPRRPRAGQRTSRWGQAIEHGPGTTRSTSHRSILQSGSSLIACDLASHVRKGSKPRWLAAAALVLATSGHLASTGHLEGCGSSEVRQNPRSCGRSGGTGGAALRVLTGLEPRLSPDAGVTARPPAGSDSLLRRPQRPTATRKSSDYGRLSRFRPGRPGHSRRAAPCVTNAEGGAV